MTRPSRDQIEQMAFMAMMDGIIHTSVPCNCPTCKSDHKSRGSTRSASAKRTASENNDGKNSPFKSEPMGTCNHNHGTPELKPSQPSKKSTSASSPQNKSSSTSSSTPARSDKVNSLLKADSVQSVLDVFNLTSTSKEEKDLANKIQNATKDCKLYHETKDKIIEVCADHDAGPEAVFGLLAKFRYERNILTTAVIKGNCEREKAFMCIQRVDHLMYMLQDVAKKKDSKGNDVMHKLGDIIMEIHDLAKTPSILYDEFLDIKEEHFDLVNDHEDMHQKFVDVNACHEKLHSSHDKLQTEHTKLLKDYTEAKKKAGTVGALKNDISRLEKSVDKNDTENADLKKEVERLNAELAKVNALKHENAQLKKKITTLSTQPAVTAEESNPSSQSQPGKKKKGKKSASEATSQKVAPSESTSEADAKFTELSKSHETQIEQLKKAHNTILRELEIVKSNRQQLDNSVREAEKAKDRAIEKLHMEKATSQNWKDIAEGRTDERDRLQTEIERYVARATRLQSSVGDLEQSLKNTETALAEQTEAHRLVRDELEQRSQTPAMSIASHQTSVLNPETIRLLRKIRSETNQLVRELDDSKSYGGDILGFLEIVQHTVRRVVSEIEQDIEEILSVRGSEPASSTNHIPEAVLPFNQHNNLPSHHIPQYSSRPEYSPQESPHMPASSFLPPYRPMVPPGFGESSAPSSNVHSYPHSQFSSTPFNRSAMESPSAPFSRVVEPPPGFSRTIEPPGFNRTIEPPSVSTSRYNTTPSSSLSVHSPHQQHHNSAPPQLAQQQQQQQPTSSSTSSNPGVIGSRSTSNNKLNPSASTPSPGTTPAPGVGVNGMTGLGNGAVGVDWNMWARSSGR